MAGAPQLLPDLQGNEGLGSGAVFLPVAFVPGTNAPQLHGKGRVPIHQGPGFGNAGVGGRQVPVGQGALHGDHAAQAKLGGTGQQPALFGPEVVVQLQQVSRPGLQIPGGPPVQDKRRHLPAGACRPQAKGGEVEGGHQRIGDLAAAASDAVGQIGKQEACAQAQGVGCLLNSSSQSLADQRALGFNRQALLPVQDPQLQVGVFQ